MESAERPGGAFRDDFQLAEWLVQPSLNRLSRGGTMAQLEPKLMDVLSFLAEHAGEVVSKNDITDAVWTGQFITDSVVTRAIAELRRALGDDAHAPSYIETISKRGYRLIARVEPLGTPAPAGIAPPPPEASPAPATFVAGQWVRGESFYGRASQIGEILDGPRNWLWLLGTRRIGKTSLLKQLEHLTASAPERGYFPFFWDLQGAEDPEGLHRDFSDALLDAGERLERCGIEVEEVRSEDLFDSLGRLRRKLRAGGLRLLLLCDEVEELIRLKDKDPALLRKLRRALQSHEDIRSVLASSVRLWALAEQRADTSPFLSGFTPPLYIGRLRRGEARELIRQSHLPAELRPELADATVERIRRRCGDHPYLIQLVRKRYLEAGPARRTPERLEEVFDEVASDPMVSYFFASDFELLTETERRVLLILSEHAGAASDTIQETVPIESHALRGSLQRLGNLGLLRRNEERRYEVASSFFRRWLQRIPMTRPLTGVAPGRRGR